MSNPSNVAVIVPFHKGSLSRDESISLRHLNHFLGPYEKFLVIPENLSLDLQGFQKMVFPEKLFRSVQSYNYLLSKRDFYLTFKRYEYILIYQLDSLVFSDQLLHWCSQGYDYIGAPWLKEFKLPWTEGKDLVGNGGFSLRKVETFLEVLDTYEKSPRRFIPILGRLLQRVPHWIRRGRNAQARRKILSDFKKHPFGVLNWLERGNCNGEDMFWSIMVPKFSPKFKKAPPRKALSFSFEFNPRLSFQMNHKALPFGCHAWAKYDRAFWEPYLLS
ncbi:MAG: hypothetical protein HYZ85_01335 [Candidatus Omnitrophica bacterium]|nr:hypothetical protein [Candidatus Omnitrophota bacterium]